MKLQIGDAAPAGVVVDIDGQPVEMNRLWADGPIFLTFLRHFG
jgi:hypothetical protein